MDATTTTRKPKALLLDDDPTVLRLLGTALEARGLELRAAMDGESGLALLLDELIGLDVLVVDLDLPRRDGRALLRLVRCTGGERDLGVVVLAEGLERGVRDELLALGADMVVDRRTGHAAAADAISSVARSRLPTAPRLHGASPPELDFARAEPAPRLARAA